MPSVQPGTATRDIQPALVAALNGDTTIASLLGPHGVGSAVKQFDAEDGASDLAWPWWIVIDSVDEVGSSSFATKGWGVSVDLRAFYRHGDTEKVSFDGVLKLYGLIAQVLDEKKLAMPAESGLESMEGKVVLLNTQVDPDGRTTQAGLQYRARVLWTG